MRQPDTEVYGDVPHVPPELIARNEDRRGLQSQRFGRIPRGAVILDHVPATTPTGRTPPPYIPPFHELPRK